ncbi:MAG: GGDEF domain-containing protein [Xanthomonadales bacterium]|nr:GGDEF domain-containing protein [Xanthomonadales bacterium]
MKATRLLWLAALLMSMPLALTAAASDPSESPATTIGVNEPRWSGLPWVDRYSPSEHGAMPVSFAVQPLPNGEVFVANAEGVLRLLGGHWERLELPGLQTARSLGWSADAGLFVGGYHHFGRLRQDVTGRFELHDLDEGFFPDRVGSPLGEIWAIHLTGDGTYFETRSEMLYLSNDGAHHRFKMSHPIDRSFLLDDGLWIHDEGDQLSRLSGVELQQVGKDVPALSHLWRGADGQLRALASERGFIRIHSDGQWSPLSQTDARAVVKSGPYAGLTLPNGDILIGCLDGSLYWYDPDLTLRQHWSLSRFPILAMAKDHEDGLWVTTEGEVLRLDLRPQWRHLSAASGYAGSLNTGMNIAEGMLLGTSVGLYLDHGGGRIELVGLAGDEVRDLLTVGEDVLVAASTGVQRWSGGTLQPVVDDANILWFLASRADPQLVYAVEDSGLLLLDGSDGQWREVERVVDPAYRFQSLAEDPQQPLLWAGQINDDPFRISLTPDRRRVLAAERISEGIDRPSGTDSNALRLGEDILVGTRSGLHRWIGDRFQPAQLGALEALTAPRFDELTLADCGSDLRFAYTSRSLLHWLDHAWQPLPLPGNRHGVVGIECASAGGVLISTWNGLSWYRPSTAGFATEPLPVMLDSAWLQPPEGPGRFLALSGPFPTIPAGASLRVRFAHPALVGGWQVESRLAPVETQWQTHAASGERQLTTLTPGRYALQLRATDNGQQHTQITEFEFQVSPPWHRQPWVQMSILVALLVTVWMLARWRTRSLQARNRHLEAMVAERTQSLWQQTAELEAANQKLQTLADQDGLTGVANRRRLDQAMELAFVDSLRGDHPLAVLMIDLDHFKQFNDTHGHQRGDERLSSTARTLQGALRWPRALLARYGGEEFVALLPDASLGDAQKVADELLRAARDIENASDRQTVSIGLAERRLHRADSPQALLTLADQALYRAKASGRDCVQTATMR